jgi:hypothetical protein
MANMLNFWSFSMLENVGSLRCGYVSIHSWKELSRVVFLNPRYHYLWVSKHGYHQRQKLDKILAWYFTHTSLIRKDCSNEQIHGSHKSKLFSSRILILENNFMKRKTWPSGPTAETRDRLLRSERLCSTDNDWLTKYSNNVPPL